MLLSGFINPKAVPNGSLWGSSLHIAACGWSGGKTGGGLPTLNTCSSMVHPTCEN